MRLECKLGEEELLARFEEHLVNIGMAPATIVNYLADVRAFASWVEQLFPMLSLLEVQDTHVRRYCQALRKHGRSPSTVNRHLQSVRKFYDFAVQSGRVSHNPAREVARLDERTAAPPRILTAAEVQRLLNAVGDSSDSLTRRDRAILLLLLKTGIKVSELVNLRMDDLVLEVGNGYVLVGQDVASGGRCLPIGAEVCAALRSYLRVRAPARDVDHLFVSRQGSPLSARSVQRLVANYARAAGLEGVSAHTLRYTFAADALSGHKPEEVARLLGLRDVSGVHRYLR